MTSLIDKLKGDKVIWMVTALLAFFSIMAVYSSISSLAYKHHGGNAEYYLFKHGLMIVTGFAIMYFMHKLPYTLFSKISKLMLLIGILMLIMTLLFGVNINNANRWLKIPVVGLSFQTSDLAKIALIVYVANKISKLKDNLFDFKTGVLPILIPTGIVCALILPANFSTAALLFFDVLVLMFIGGVPIKNLLKIVGAGVAGFVLLILVAKGFPDLLPRLSTWGTRITTFISGSEVVNADAAYQTMEAKKAIYNGNFFGQGPGNGDSRNSMPHPYSDMIYAFIIEEYGAIFGGIGILGLYIILFIRVIKIGANSEKNSAALMAYGIGFMLVFQALINMAVAVNLFPVTGQPLPLVSMGGTSTWFTCLAIGIILSVSKSAQNKAEKENYEGA